jgi:hypothetical protein
MPSARGDLEILGYCLLQWWSGSLPWDQHVRNDHKDSVAQMKIRFKSDVAGLLRACFTSGAPPACLRHYMTYVHSLGYEAAPDYGKARQMFMKELSSLGLRDDGKHLDWLTSSSKSKAPRGRDECDLADSTSPPPPPPSPVKRKGGARGGVQRARATPTEPGPSRKPAAQGKGKKPRSREPEVAIVGSDSGEDSWAAEVKPTRKKATTARGRKRKSPASRKPVESARSIKPASSDAGSAGGVDPGIMPQVSYPSSLGYVGNGEPGDLEPSTKRLRAPPQKKPPRSQSARSASKKSKALSPAKQKKPRARQKASSDDLEGGGT